MNKTSDTPEITRLIQQAQAGDREALEALLLSQQPIIYRFGRRLCRDPEDAAEILQETMLSLARSIQDFRGDASLSTWLYRVAHSACSKRHRRSKFAPKQEESLDDPESLWEPADPSKDPEQSTSSREVKEILDEAIAALAPAYREVLLLRDVEGLSAAEVAEVLEVSVEAVKSRLHRARLAVRERVSPKLEETTSLDCPDVLRLFSQHQEGELSASFCAQMEAHLERCPPCKSRCDSLKKVLTLCRTMPSPEAPPELQKQLKSVIQQIAKKSSLKE